MILELGTVLKSKTALPFEKIEGFKTFPHHIRKNCDAFYFLRDISSKRGSSNLKTKRKKSSEYFKAVFILTRIQAIGGKICYIHPEENSFLKIVEVCTRKMLYNGNIHSTGDIQKNKKQRLKLQFQDL